MSSMAKFDGKRWLDEVKKDMSLENVSYGAPPCIFGTSKALLKEYKDAYVPQIVSIGPFHFGREELGGMETYKGDAARREVVRIQNGTNNYGFTFGEVIEKIRKKEKEIKRCYDKGTPAFQGEVFLWMMARDACFILEFFRNHLSGLPEGDDAKESFKNDFGFWPSHHPIFGPECENPGVKSEIRKDLIKMDNQIPLFILEDVLSMETMDSLDSAKVKLNKLLSCMFQKFFYRPFEFCEPGESPKGSHLLDIYHYSCLGGVVAPENENELNLNVYCTCFVDSNGVQCSCFGRGPRQYWARLRNNVEHERGGSPTTSAEIGRDVRDAKHRKEWWLKVPSAVELKNGGVKFQADCKTVDNIKFEGKTLTLVQLKLDADSEFYIRNLIAVEICSPNYKHKRMTAYAKFMHELCQADGGVDVMRERGIIIGNLWHNKRVTRLLSVSNLTSSQPACKSVKETRERLNECYKTRRSIILTSLWNEFWKAYGSKPWLVIGGIGATIVLFLTAIQVFCLFKSCGASSK